MCFLVNSVGVFMHRDLLGLLRTIYRNVSLLQFPEKSN